MRWSTTSSIYLGITLALVTLVGLAATSLIFNERSDELVRAQNALRVRILSEVQMKSLVKDAESAQRGYLLTGKERYLVPYNKALGAVEAGLNSLDASPALRKLVHAKMDELADTLRLYDSGRIDEAIALVRTDQGQALTETIRSELRDMRNHDEAALQERLAELETAARTTTVVLVLGQAAMLLMVLSAFYLGMREKARVERAEREARFAMREAQAASQVRTQFLANMSHEIRTPLNAVIGMNDLLLDTSLDGRQKEFARIARDAGSALLQVINHILDFSKIDAGKMDLESIRFSLAAAVEAQAEIMAMRGVEKDVQLLCFVDPRLPQGFVGDPARIGQVLLNLVGNAIKFTPGGGSVMLRTLPANGHPVHDDVIWVRFEVTDTGPGVNPDVLERLFKPFSQADSSTSRRYGGTGLGLAIAKSLVELMGGTIGCNSRVGEGATFWCELPLRRDHAATRRVALPLAEPLRKLRVLVVDDDARARLILCSYLGAWELETHEAANVDEAIEILHNATQRSAPYHLIFADMMMPSKTGIDLAAEINTHTAIADSHPHLVLVTGFDKVNLGRAALTAGFSAFLTKPLKQSQVFDCIASIYGDNVRPLAPSAASPDITPTARRLILVAEDSTVNQLVLSKQLETLGYAAHIVANGREAVEAMNRGSYDLVLMDCQMPEMDGYEATQRIRAEEAIHHTGKVPIIALTANAQREDEIRCLQAGMTAYLTKPVQREPLRRELQRWIK